MALQSLLQQAQQQLEEVRQNRQRADEDVEVRPGGGTGRRWRGEPRHRLLNLPWSSIAQALPSPDCVASDKWPNLSELQVPHLRKGTGNCIAMKIKQDSTCYLFSKH